MKEHKDICGENVWPTECDQCKSMNYVCKIEHITEVIDCWCINCINAYIQTLEYKVKMLNDKT